MSDTIYDAFSDKVVTLHECHGVSNHLQLDSLFNCWFRLTNKASKHCWLWRSPVVSPYKMPTMQKWFPCHDVIREKYVLWRTSSVLCLHMLYGTGWGIFSYTPGWVLLGPVTGGPFRAHFAISKSVIHWDRFFGMYNLEDNYDIGIYWRDIALATPLYDSHVWVMSMNSSGKPVKINALKLYSM